MKCSSLALFSGLMLAVFCGAGVLSYVEHAAAQASDGAGAQYRIAVVDMNVLLSEYRKRKEKYDELQREVDRLQQEIDAMSQKIERAKVEYNEMRPSMTENERFDKRAQIESDHAQYQSELGRRQRLIDTQEERVLKEVVGDIERVLAQIGETEGYHLILNAAKGPRASLLYHSPTIDITPKVLQVLNQ